MQHSVIQLICKNASVQLLLSLFWYVRTYILNKGQNHQNSVKVLQISELVWFSYISIVSLFFRQIAFSLSSIFIRNSFSSL